MSANELTKEIAVRQDYGNAMKKLFKFYNTLPDPDPILIKTGKAFDSYRDLTTDPHLYANIQQRKAGIVGLERKIEPTENSGTAGYIISHLQNELDIDNIITQMLNAPLYGFSVLEIVWETVRFNSSALLLPKKIEEKPQEWFTFGMNNELLYQGESSVPQAVPADKFILIQNNATYLNPYGEKALSRCYYPVMFKRNGLEYWVNFTEKYGMPFIIGKQPRTTSESDSDTFLSQLQDISLSNAAVIPDDTSIEILSFPSGASIDAYRTFLEFMNSEISKAVLTQTLTTELQNRGSYAATETHKEMLSMLTRSDMKPVEKGMNRILNITGRLNGMHKPPGRFKFLPHSADL